MSSHPKHVTYIKIKHLEILFEHRLNLHVYRDFSEMLTFSLHHFKMLSSVVIGGFQG